MDYLSSYSDLFGSIDVSGIIWSTIIITVLTIIAIIVFKYLSIKKKQGLEKERDQKLQKYFEDYSDIIADKVIAKLNEQNKKAL